MQRNLKLAVISQLMEQGDLPHGTGALAKKKGDKGIEDRLAYFEELALTKKQLDAVTELEPDGGDLVYQAIFSASDSKGDFMDRLDDLVITSFEGIGACKNLQTIRIDDALVEDGISIAAFAELGALEELDIDIGFDDLDALLECKKLRRVSMSGDLSKAEKKIVAQLEARGVELELT